MYIGMWNVNSTNQLCTVEIPTLGLLTRHVEQLGRASLLQHATWQRSLHIQTLIALAHKIRSTPTRCSPNTFSCKTSRRFTRYFSNFVHRPNSLKGRQQWRDIPEKAHGTTIFPFFLTLKRNIRKNPLLR